MVTSERQQAMQMLQNASQHLLYNGIGFNPLAIKAAQWTLTRAMHDIYMDAVKAKAQC